MSRLARRVEICSTLVVISVTINWRVSFETSIMAIFEVIGRMIPAMVLGLAFFTLKTRVTMGEVSFMPSGCSVETMVGI